MRQPALELWRRAIFVDWHGVLSRARWWASILDDERHPLHEQLRTGLDALSMDDERLARWMTGRSGADEIVASLGVQPYGRYTTSYLRLQLDRDYRTLAVNVQLLRVLRTVRDRAFVVIASDNNDSFASAYRRLAARRGRWTETTAETLAAWASCCDDLICSSDVGITKVDDAGAFFGPYLRASNLGFRDALLIDDAIEDCDAFRALGGTAICWSDHDPLEPLTAAVETWING